MAADTGKDDDPPVVATASYGYARLRKESYEPGELTRWAVIFKDQGWDDVYVFFKHEDASAGPAVADLFVKEVQSNV